MLKNNIHKRKEVFALANIAWDNPVDLIQLFQPEILPDILKWYIQSNESQKAQTAWQEIVRADLIDRQSALGYTNFLLRQSEIAEAGVVWKSAFSYNGRLLYNSDLKQPFTGSGFGWRMRKEPGVSWANPEDSKGLTVQFSGEENALFSLSQTVPLAPGDYVLHGIMDSDALTTDQRPFWAVRGIQCRMSATGEMVASAQDAKGFSLSFTVPEECQAVRISLLRKKSYYFDNKISGSLTIYNLGVDKVEVGN